MRSWLMLEQHLSIIKNIASNNQQNITITKSFAIYVYEIATDAVQLTAMAVVMDSHQRFPNLDH